MTEPQHVLDIKAIPWNRDDYTLEEQWTTAQECEVEFQVWHITLKKKYSTRAEFLRYERRLGRVALRHFGLELSSLTGHVLDVGCGVASVLEGSDCFVVALDPNLTAYHERLPEFARLGHVDNCFYRSCLIQDIQKTDFDTVFCINVIDHSIDWQDMITNMYRVLRPGGLLLLAVTVAEKRFGGQVRRMEHPSIIQFDALLDCIRDNGFKIDWHNVPGDAVHTLISVVARK